MSEIEQTTAQTGEKKVVKKVKKTVKKAKAAKQELPDFDKIKVVKKLNVKWM